MNKWQDPSLTLGERCVAFAENELKNNVKEDKPSSYTSPRIKEYFSICTRQIKGKEVNIHFTQGNWCAASASFSLKNSLLPGENSPHGYRLGVVEIVTDLQRNGLWKPIGSVVTGKYTLQIGDLIVFDRSKPGKSETAWFRHIGRVYEITSTGFKCISGNSSGQWMISNHKLSQLNLLGFGQYPTATSTIGVPSKGIDWSHIDLDDLAPLYDTGIDLASDNFYVTYRNHFKK